MAWETQGVRFVLYSQQLHTLPEAAEVWKSILPGREPDSVQRNMNVAPGVTQSLAGGPVRGLNFTVTVQPTRLDLFVGRPDIWITGSNTKTATLDDLLEPVSVYGKKLVEAHRAIRLAVVADSVDEARDWSESADKFKAAMPQIQLPEVARELAFSLNATRSFTSADQVTMNRLCKWETALFQFMAMPVTGPSGMSPAQFAPQKHALALQTDLSSEIRSSALESEHATAILAELLDETRLIVEQGYQRLLS